MKLKLSSVKPKEKEQEGCLLCGAPLLYLTKDEPMECSVCHKKEPSRARCEKGHYVCNDCHTRGVDSILSLCLQEKSRNPLEILEKMMALPFCHMHGPEHHMLVGAALLTACKNAGAELKLPEALTEMINRGREVPGGVCGFWGACGAGISTGMFVSILSGSTPLTVEPWGLSNRMTSRALDKIGEVGGPRCCKRDSYLAILAAIAYVKEQFGLELEQSDIICDRAGINKQCIGKRCPFSKANH